MNIKTEQDVTGAAAAYLRKLANKPQSEFWAEFGVTQSGGCRYELGNEIPKPIRTLIFLQHVAGLKIDASTSEGAESLVKLGKLQASEHAEHKEKIGAKLQSVMENVKKARATLRTV